MAKASKEQAAEHRAKVVAVASSLFREKGLSGVGIDDLMAEAGLTRGGFYGHFASKDQLAGEACAHAFERAEAVWTEAVAGNATERLQRLTELYFTPKRLGNGCPMATLASDAARASAGGPVRRAFTAGLRRLANVVMRERADSDALAVLAAMVGALVLRQASEDDALSDAIEAAVRRLAFASDAGSR